MTGADSETLEFLCEEQFSFQILFEKLRTYFKQFPKLLFQLLQASGVAIFVSPLSFPGNVVFFFFIVLLLGGAIPLPDNLAGLWTIVEFFLIAIAGLTALFFFISILMIFIAPEVSFKKERIQIGGNIIKLEELIKIQISETEIAHCIDIHYRYSDNQGETKDTIYLVINEATKEKLDKMKSWCEQKQIAVEMA